MCGSGDVGCVKAGSMSCAHGGIAFLKAEVFRMNRRRRVCVGGGMRCVRAEAWGLCRLRRGGCASGGKGCR